MIDRDRLAPRFALAAGAGDLGTGIALLAAPELVLRLLTLPPVGEPIYLRFVGAFVASVGAAYFWPFAGAERGERTERLRAAFTLTALTRFAVAAFLALAVASGALGTAWLLVGGYDALVAVVQLGLRPAVRGIASR